MTEEIKLGADAIIYTPTNETEWKHVEGKSGEDYHLDFAMGFDAPVRPVENIILDQSHPVIIGKAWICKTCKLDNMGVICSECKKMYNPVDCELKD